MSTNHDDRLRAAWAPLGKVLAARQGAAEEERRRQTAARQAREGFLAEWDRFAAETIDWIFRKTIAAAPEGAFCAIENPERVIALMVGVAGTGDDAHSLRFEPKPPGRDILIVRTAGGVAHQVVPFADLNARTVALAVEDFIAAVTAAVDINP
jgi:hypothetical protein